MGIVTATDGQTLDTAAKLLMNPDLTSQIESNLHAVRKGAEVGNTAVKPADQYALKDIGYDSGIYLEGPYKQQTTVGIKLASNRLVVPGAKAVLHIRYAQNLDFSKSMATVYVNGIPVGSKKLEKSRSDEDSVEVSIPNDAIKSHYVELRVAFDLQMTNSECERVQSDTPWAFVDGASTVYLPTKDERALLLENYPWPLVKDGKINDVAVVIPNAMDSRELDFLADLFGYIGRDLQDNTGMIEVIKDSEFTEPDKEHNYIMVGAPGELQSLRKMNAELWFQYDPKYGFFQSNERRRLLESFSANLASVQLIPSPGNPERGILVVTAPKKDNLIHAKKYLTETKFATALVGNALMADRWENATNHYFSNGDNLNIVDKVNLSSPQLKVFAVMFGTVMLIIIIGVIWHWRKYRRR
jgi:hypothetical protein